MIVIVPNKLLPIISFGKNLNNHLVWKTCSAWIFHFRKQFCVDLFGMVSEDVTLSEVKWPTIGDEKVTAWITWDVLLWLINQPTNQPIRKTYRTILFSRIFVPCFLFCVYLFPDCLFPCFLLPRYWSNSNCQWTSLPYLRLQVMSVSRFLEEIFAPIPWRPGCLLAFLHSFSPTKNVRFFGG